LTLCVYNEQYVLLKTDNNAHVIKWMK